MESEIANWIFQAHDSDLNRKDSRTAAIIGLAERIVIAVNSNPAGDRITAKDIFAVAESFFAVAEEYAKKRTEKKILQPAPLDDEEKRLLAEERGERK